jgi:hypothetical protein
MKTFTNLSNLATSLTQNTSTANVTLMQQLINDRHRYLLQRYFDNERSVQLSTIGSMALNATASIPLNATSATLTSSWTYPTYTILVNFSDGEQRPVLFTNGSTTITWVTPISGTSLSLVNSLSTGATSATLASIWSFSTQNLLSQFSDGEQKTVTYTKNSTAISWTGGLTGPVGATIQTSEVTQSINTLGVQSYSIPADVSKIKNGTITIGQLKFQPVPIESIQEWDLITMLPYNSDIPNYFFIYNGKMSIFPIPSTTGNVINFNYKTRVADMTFTDTTGTLATMVSGSTAVTGTATAWNTQYPNGVPIQYLNLYLRADPATGGDGIWYPIYQFNSATSLTLALPVVNAPAITTSTTYTIGQMPILQEDFHDMITYSALRIYFSSIVLNEEKYREFDALFKEGLELLKDYDGSKQVNVDLEATPNQINPNLFVFANNS